MDNKTVYYENNIYAAKSGKKWGFVDARNNAIVPYQYDEVTELDEYGFAGINKNGKWGVINSNGDIIISNTAYVFSNSSLPFKMNLSVFSEIERIFSL